MSRPTIRLLLLLATTLVFIGISAGPAAAHDDEGTVTITRAEQVGASSVLVEVGIVFAGDGHLAEDAEVTATLSSAGTTVGPVELDKGEDGTSLYSATIDVPSPGVWAIEVTSTDPSGTTTASVTVADGAPSTTTPASTTAPDPTATVPTSDPAASAEDSASTSQLATSQEEDSGASPALVIGACLLLAAVVIGGAFVVARQRSREDEGQDPGAD